MSNVIDDQDDEFSESDYEREIDQAAANFHLPWQRIIQDILAHYTQEQLVDEAGLTPANLLEILNKNQAKLRFRIGAKLFAIHCRLCPAEYA